MFVWARSVALPRGKRGREVFAQLSRGAASSPAGGMQAGRGDRLTTPDKQLLLQQLPMQQAVLMHALLISSQHLQRRGV